MKFKRRIPLLEMVTLLALTIPLQACGHSEDTGENTSRERETFAAEIMVDGGNARRVNPYLLGNNVQWVDRGDELLSAATMRPNPAVMDKVRKLGVSVLRYPGGSLADLYHWKDGMGSAGERKTNRRFHAKGKDRILLGTFEFLSICREIGAEPLITINVVTGSPKEAAEWVEQVNIKRLRDASGILPKVKYWEIGNEPYLIDDNQRSLAVQPGEYARRANRFIREMRRVDPTIRIGIPLRSDKLAGFPATPFPGYNKKVLSEIKEAIDFVSVHNAYYPFIYDKAPSDSAIYLATMSSPDIVMENIRQTRSELKRYRKEKHIPIALTEYNAMFTMGNRKKDGYIASLTGALYIADLLMKLGTMDDLLMANYWSLSGNWYFGTVDQRGRKRPSYHVLKAFHAIWNGHVLNTEVESPTFQSPGAGIAPKRKGIRLVDAITTIQGDRLRVMIINKHRIAKGSITLDLSKLHKKVASIHMKELTAKNYFAFDKFDDDKVAWRDSTVRDHLPLKLTLSPHSLAVVEMQLR